MNPFRKLPLNQVFSVTRYELSREECLKTTNEMFQEQNTIYGNIYILIYYALYVFAFC